MHGIDADFFLSQFQRDLTSEFLLLHCDSQMKLWHCQCNVPVCLSPSATALPGAALVCALRILFRESLRELLHCFPADLRFGQISVVLFSRSIHGFWSGCVTGLLQATDLKEVTVISAHINYSFPLLTQDFWRQMSTFCISVKD